MKFKKPILFFLIAVCLSFIVYGFLIKSDSEVAELKTLDAAQALALANQWRWSRNDVKSYVTPLDVVFEFDKNRVVNIPLPDDKMVVAIAPYIDETHK